MITLLRKSVVKGKVSLEVGSTVFKLGFTGTSHLREEHLVPRGPSHKIQDPLFTITVQ